MLGCNQLSSHLSQFSAVTILKYLSVAYFLVTLQGEGSNLISDVTGKLKDNDGQKKNTDIFFLSGLAL